MSYAAGAVPEGGSTRRSDVGRKRSFVSDSTLGTSRSMVPGRRCHPDARAHKLLKTLVSN